MGRPRGSRNKSTLATEAAQIFKQVRFEVSTITDVTQYLSERSLEYVKRLELIADEARANCDPELELKTVAFLSRMSPAYKTKVDVSASQLGLLKAPDLSGKSDAELQAALVEVESTEIKEQ